MVVGFNIRVLALHGDALFGPQWVFRAAAFKQNNRSNEPVWACHHDHECTQSAFECGTGWLHGGAVEGAA